MTTIDQARAIADAIVKTLDTDDDPRYGEEIDACRYFALVDRRTGKTAEIEAAQAAFDACSITRSFASREGLDFYTIHGDGSIGTCLQAQDEAYATLADFLADFPGEADAS